MLEAQAEKARRMRYKKPLCNSLNWNTIVEDVWQIQSDCGDIQWMTEDEEQLIDLLDGDEEQAFEFRIAFSDLCSQCQAFLDELKEVRRYDFISQDNDEENEASLFDLFFPAVGQRDLYGFDEYEQDYFKLEIYEADYAAQEARKKLKRLTKDQLLDAAGICLRIAEGYRSLSYRYDCLKTSIDILKGKNETYLKTVRYIEALWEVWERESLGGKYEYTSAGDDLDRILRDIPDRIWIE